MQKLLSKITIMDLLCGIMVSCSKGDDSESSPFPSNPDETIIVFMPYSKIQQTATDITEMKTSIKTRGGLGNKRLVVCKASGENASDLYEIYFKDGACRDSAISKGMTLQFVSTNQTQVTADIQTVLQKIKTWAPSKSYSMIVGCHGSAWVPAGTLLTDFEPTSSAKQATSTKRRAFGTASKEYQIDNISLATALQNENMHLNFLMFDACYMANIETIYEYHNVCDYFIGSCTEILSDGMPYGTVFAKLLDHDYEGVVDEYYSAYKSTYGTLCYIDCKYVDDMAAIVKDITANSYKSDADVSQVQSLELLTQHLFFDMQHFMDTFCSDATKLATFTAKMKQLVPYARTTEKFFTSIPSYKAYPVMSHYCGISTSQPTVNTKGKELLPKTGWWIATH